MGSTIMNSLFVLALGLCQGKLPTAAHSIFTWWFVEALLLGSQKIWFPAKAVQFFLVPKLYHLLYVNCVAFLWNIILTSIVADGERAGGI
jgi:hypothetical protein